MTTSQAKKIISAAMTELGLPALKLTARTIGFSDLARDTKVFVSIHGWKPSPLWKNLETVARQHGFFIQKGE